MKVAAEMAKYVLKFWHQISRIIWLLLSIFIPAYVGFALAFRILRNSRNQYSRETGRLKRTPSS
jgi:hypothetical protein